MLTNNVKSECLIPLHFFAGETVDEDRYIL